MIRRFAAFVPIVLVGCTTPTPTPAPAPPQIAPIQYDKCGNDVRNPTGLPSDVVSNMAISNPDAYAQLLGQYYRDHPQCQR